MTKIAINTSYGGFGLSDAAIVRLAELKGVEIKLVHTAISELIGEHVFYREGDDPDTCDPFAYDLARDDPHLVQVIEELGHAAGGSFASLKVVEIPDDVIWDINEYDGSEWIAEQHRTWS